MSNHSPGVLLTADEFEQLPEDDSVQTELDEGVVIESDWSPEYVGAIESEIIIELYGFARVHGLGRVYPGDTGFRLNDRTVRAPNAAFVRAERVPIVKSRGFAKGTPDLAIEIFSPGNSVPQLMRKVKQYFAAGCQTVWIFYPDRREVHVLEAAGTDRILGANDRLEAPELLPGFVLELSALFEPDPDSESSND